MAKGDGRDPVLDWVVVVAALAVAVAAAVLLPDRVERVVLDLVVR